MKLALLRGAVAALIVAASAAVAQACPDWRASPSFGQIQLVAGFLPDPFERRITAGGSHSIQGCIGENWPGFVARRPDFDLYWRGNSGRLTFIVDTRADSVLLVNDPNGTWFYNDDIDYQNGDLRSVVVINNPREGLYNIWIGSYDGSRRNPGRLYITER